jgi:CHAD domain-containing protein
MQQSAREIHAMIVPLLFNTGFRLDRFSPAKAQLAEAGWKLQSDKSDKNDPHKRLEIVVLDAFRGALRRTGRVLLGVEVGRHKWLLLADEHTQTLSAIVSWAAATWPKFPWDIASAQGEDAAALAALLDKTIGFWALQPCLIRSLMRSEKRVLDQRGKTVAYLHSFDPEKSGKEMPSEGLSSIHLSVTGVRGFTDEFEQIMQTLLPVLTPTQPMMTELLEGLDERIRTQSIPSAIYAAEDVAIYAVSKLLSVATDEMIAHTQGMQDDIDTEFLHQYRVHLRKIRSLLKECKSLFTGETMSPHLHFFKRISDLTTPVRDFDVHLLMIDDWMRQRRNAFVDQLVPLRKLIAGKRKRSLAALLNYVGSEKYLTQLRDWQQLLSRLQQVGPQQPEPQQSELQQPEPQQVEPQQVKPKHHEVGSKLIGLYAAKRIQKCFTKLVADGSKLHEFSPDEAFHDLRLDMKRFRYLLEYFEAIFTGGRYAAISKLARKLQSVLGDFHDITVQKAVLMGYAEELQQKRLAGPQTFVCLGFLLHEMSNNHDQLRTQFHGIFAQINTEANLHYIRKLQDSPLN